MKKGIAALSTAAILSSALASPALAANTYTVKSGDSLSKIAKSNQTTVAKLKSLNKLSSDLIYVNQILKLSSSSKASVKDDRVTVKKTSAKTYTVVPGDNLTKIANKHNITLAELKSLNSLKSTVIYPGDVLTVSKTVKTTVISLPKSSKKADTGSKTPPATGLYTIKSGDTLSKIAQSAGMTVKELKELNGLKSDLIIAGKTLKISKNSSTPVTEDAKPAPTPSKQPESTPKQDTYTIQPGDSLSKIAAKFGMSVSELKNINGMTSDLIFAGKTLKVSKSAAGDNSPGQKTEKPQQTSAAKLIAEAKKWIGVPYSWAGSSPAGFDCSGFVYYAMKQSGYSISRVSASTYYDMGKSVKEPQPGNLVFFGKTPESKQVITHMGIYIGDGQFIHASSSKGVMISPLSQTYYKTRLAGFKSF